jgi:hypothetical protein
MHRDTTDVKREMCDYTRGNWSHRNSNESFKEKFRTRTGKTFSRFATEGSCTWNMTRSAESIAVWNLIPEQWGSAFVRQEYREEMACDLGQHNNNININSNNTGM